MTYFLDTDLVGYYEREIAFLREMGTLFSDKHPKIGSRLQLSPYDCPDPHVERLIEAFAFLSGRLQRDIESQFPEIAQSFLEILYPQLVRPIPSMGVVQFQVKAGQGKITSGHNLPAGTPLVAESRQGIPLRFRTSAPAELWPVAVVDAHLEPARKYQFLDDRPDVLSVLRLSLTSQEAPFSDLDMDSLRFFLQGAGDLVPRLVDMIFAHVEDVVLVRDFEQESGELKADQRLLLKPRCIRQTGFGVEETLLPYPPFVHQGYRLLQEYFNFPHKFRFAEVSGLREALKRLAGRKPDQDLMRIDMLLLLNKPFSELSVRPENFLLNCAPFINLFSLTSDPIRLDHTRHEYQLIPDSRRSRAVEVFAVNKVSRSRKIGDEDTTLAPFFSFSHHKKADAHFWIATRRPALKDMHGTDMFLSFLDLDCRGHLPEEKVVYAHCLCSNRNVAEQVPSKALLEIDSPSPLATGTCLIAPTPSIRPSLGHGTLWKLVSHLSLNYLSLSEQEKSLDAFKEMLFLYAQANNATHAHQIKGIQAMSTKRVVQHIGEDAWRGFCRGLQVTLEFDQSFYTGSSALLLASVLNHFFAQYASVNSFTKLVIQDKDRKDDNEVWKEWPPIAGKQALI